MLHAAVAKKAGELNGDTTGAQNWVIQQFGTSYGNVNYAEDMENQIALKILERAALTLVRDNVGITVFLFTHMTNLASDQNSWTVGSAVDGDRHSRAPFLLATADNPRAHDTDPGRHVAITAAHEYGHALFLSHAPQSDPAPDGTVAPVAGQEPPAHDTADTLCIMGYRRDRDHFCGLCLLRLRGWQHGTQGGHQILSNTAAQNAVSG
jgi:hypothetical protein